MNWPYKADMDNVNILYTNARSLFNKVDKVKVAAVEYAAQIICVTETWLNSDILDAEVAIPDYTLYREDRKNNTRYGGSAIYVHNCLEVVRLEWFDGLESLAINVKTDSHEFYLYVCTEQQLGRL